MAELKLIPLEHSNEADRIEEECKRLFLMMYEKMRSDVADINANSVQWLGSDALIKQTANNDGLILINNIEDDALLKTLYLAWRSQRGKQKRGLDFVRFYLSLMFGEHATVEQLWLDASKTYPTTSASNIERYSWWRYQLNEPNSFIDGDRKFLGTDLSATRRAARITENPEAYLSSRVRIALSFNAGNQSLERIQRIMYQIMPARLVPEFVLWAAETIDLNISVDGTLDIGINQTFIHDNPELEIDGSWEVRDSNPETLADDGFSVTFTRN